MMTGNTSLPLLRWTFLLFEVYFIEATFRELALLPSSGDCHYNGVSQPSPLIWTISERCTLWSTYIPKVFFRSHHVGHCCTNVIRGDCFVSFDNDLSSHFAQQCVPTIGLRFKLSRNVFQQWHLGPHCCTTMDLGHAWQTDDMDWSLMCFTLMLEHEEHLKT
jgi:hypothetical protein